LDMSYGQLIRCVDDTLFNLEGTRDTHLNRER